MIQYIEPAKRNNLTFLFTEHKPSFLIDTVLEGHLGAAMADDINNPCVAQLAYADILTIGGDTEHSIASEFVEQLPVDKGILPLPEKWHDLLHQVYGDRLISVERFSFSAEQLELEHLNLLIDTLPAGFQIKQIDLDLACQIDADSTLISEDHVQNFNSPEDFVERGLGFCVLEGERIVSGASSYAICNRGIEVQVNTHPEYQGKGLATAVSAALLAYCLEHNIEAHWDAGNPTSVKLAEKLGYIANGKYEMLVRIE
ncbi:MAG: GNAT family N-acetyltransferase [Chloroflexi bacterium]|nr:GNAT family N-acetyltransferase [Chloroflexota bacterium]